MQDTINIPDNLPPAMVKQEVNEFEAKLKRLTLRHLKKISSRSCISSRRTPVYSPLSHAILTKFQVATKIRQDCGETHSGGL
jgi:hypothetical protein